MKFVAYVAIGIAIALSGCATGRHEFAAPDRAWTTRSGQLSYRNPKRSLIGDVLLRYDPRGNFELTFTKGPGVPLLVLKTGADFARLSGPLAILPWSGPIARPPERARGWLKLRDAILQSGAGQIVRTTEGSERFVLRF